MNATFFSEVNCFNLCTKEYHSVVGGKQGKTQKLQLLFEQWVSANENWSSSSLIVRMKNSHRKSHKGGRRWLSFEQISMKYQSDEVAREITSTKEADPILRKTDTKQHPDRPGKLLYLCWDEEFVTEERDELVEQLFENRDDGSGDSSDDDHKKNKTSKKRQTEKTKKRKARSPSPAPSLSSSSSESSDSSSSASGKSGKTTKTKATTKSSGKTGKPAKKDKKQTGKKNKKEKKETPEQREKKLKKEREKELKDKERKEKAEQEKIKRGLRNEAKKASYSNYITNAFFFSAGSHVPLIKIIDHCCWGAGPSVGCHPRHFETRSKVQRTAGTLEDLQMATQFVDVLKSALKKDILWDYLQPLRF